MIDQKEDMAAIEVRKIHVCLFVVNHKACQQLVRVGGFGDREGKEETEREAVARFVWGCFIADKTMTCGA